MDVKGFFARLAGRDKLDAVTRAEVQVALLIAALDGDVSREEVAEFHRLAQASAHWSAEAERRAFDAAIRSAGYLMLLARVAAKEELLKAFADEAEKFLPLFFALNADERAEAVAVWKELANADGMFAEIEREAIAYLDECLKLRSAAASAAGVAAPCLCPGP